MSSIKTDEIENETDMKVADSLTTWRSQRAREAICRKSAQTFHLPLVKYEDEYIFKFPLFLRFSWIYKLKNQLKILILEQ